MRSYIFCRTENKGCQTFYLRHYGRNYYLFRQPYRVSVRETFQSGYELYDGYNYGTSRSTSVKKTLDKLKQAILYIEKEYGITVLRRTKEKNSKRVTYRYKRIKGESQNYGIDCLGE